MMLTDEYNDDVGSAGNVALLLLLLLLLTTTSWLLCSKAQLMQHAELLTAAPMTDADSGGLQQQQ